MTLMFLTKLTAELYIIHRVQVEIKFRSTSLNIHYVGEIFPVMLSNLKDTIFM
jgi:hypothetical protein